MGLFGDIFDFNNDGKVSFEEELFGLGMIGAISAELSTKCDITSDDDEDDDYDDLDEEDDSDAPVSISITLKSDADDIESDLEELRDKLQELEIDEPDDVLSRKHDRWEQRCDISPIIERPSCASSTTAPCRLTTALSSGCTAGPRSGGATTSLPAPMPAESEPPSRTR